MYNPLKSEYTKIKKIGKWTILVHDEKPESLIIESNDFTCYGIIYWDRVVAYDHPEKMPEGVKKFIREKYATRFSIKAENGYSIRFNTMFNHWQISHKNIGANIAEFKNLNDALVYCENG